MAVWNMACNQGDRYGMLTVLDPSLRIQSGTATTRQGKPRTYAAALVQCECGKERIVSQQSLRSGSTRSCGCFRRAVTAERSRTHGMGQHPLYNTWKNMKARCYNPKSPDYKHYGGRGIEVCSEWRESFPEFLAHVSQLDHYGEEGRTIDRIENDGNYEPGNVHWQTAGGQARNKRPKSGRGVRLRSSGRWAAEIRLNYKMKHLGTFDTEDEARAAYLTEKEQANVG